MFYHINYLATGGFILATLFTQLSV